MFLSAHPLLVVEEMLEAACWAIASALLAVSSRRTGDDLTRWLAIAGVLAALSALNYALLPTHLVELMYLGDYFFLGAVAVLLFAAVREVGLAEAALVDRAVYAERRRIARDMHDGVTQELAFIASQALAVGGSPDRSAGALRRIRDAVERALDQSRTAIAELSGPVDGTLAASIATTVQVVTRRTGAHVDLAVDESLVESDAIRSALVRVTRDALTLAHQQGASRVRIRIHRDGVLSLTVVSDSERTGTIDESRWAAALTSIRDSVAGVDGEVGLQPRGRRHHDPRGAGAVTDIPRVLIADDHQAIRVGVRDALEAGGCEVVGEADTAYVAVDLTRRLEPDACLLDIAMPGSGLWAVREILSFAPHIRCIMLTVSDSADDIVEALESGASGYLLKDVSPDLVPEAVRKALAGEAVLSGRLTSHVVDALRARPTRQSPVIGAHGRPVTFTNREADVLELLVEGATTAEIAARLFVRQITVRRHIADAMHKLHVGSRAEAVVLLQSQHADLRAAPGATEQRGWTRERDDEV